MLLDAIIFDTSHAVKIIVHTRKTPSNNYKQILLFPKTNRMTECRVLIYLQNLIYLYLFTDCFMKISLQSLEQISEVK